MKRHNAILLLALFLVSFNLRVGITTVSPMLETIRAALGMNGTEASLLTSIPVLCMGLFSPLAAFGIRWGIERVLIWAFTLIGVGTALRVFAGSTWLLLLTALFIGVGIAVAGPLISGFIKKYFPAKVASMVGIYACSMGVGATVSSGFAVPVFNWFNGSWRMALGIWAVFMFLALPVWWQAIVRKSGNAASLGPFPPAQHRGLPWRNKRAWLLTLFSGLCSAIYFSSQAWIAPVAESMGHTNVFAGALSTVFVLVQLPVTMLVPMIMQKFPNRFFWLLGCSLCELAGFLLMNVIAYSPWVSAILVGIGAGALFPLALLLAIDETLTPEEASSWTAMTQSGGYIIAATGPLLVGWIRDVTGTFLFSILSLIIMCLLCIILEFIITTRQLQKNLISVKS